MDSSQDTATLVSIIMPAYNAGRFIRKAITSVVEQTYQNWQLIIVNDCSTDNTVEVAQQFVAQDSRIQLIQQAHNGGVAKARNTALEQAQGDYIAFLDSDDYWLVSKLEKQMSMMSRSDVSICHSYYQRMDEFGHLTNQVKAPDQVSYQELLKSNFIGNLTGLYNAKLLGKFYFKSVKHEDYVNWLALLKTGYDAYCIPEVLAHYRVYSQSTSANKLKAMTWQWNIYRQQEELSLMSSVYYMGYYAYYALMKRR